MSEDTFMIQGTLHPLPGHVQDIWLALRKLGCNVAFDKKQLQLTVFFCGLLPYYMPTSAANDIAPWVQNGYLVIRNQDRMYVGRQDYKDGTCHYCPATDLTYYQGHEKEFAAHLPWSVVQTVLAMYGTQ